MIVIDKLSFQLHSEIESGLTRIVINPVTTSTRILGIRNSPKAKWIYTGPEDTFNNSIRTIHLINNKLIFREWDKDSYDQTWRNYESISER